MKRGLKNVLLYLLIIVAAVAAINSFSEGTKSKSEITYTSFLQEVQRKNVESVTITGDHSITGKLKTGTEFTTYAPSDESIYNKLTEGGVDVTAQPPEQPAWWISLLSSALPIVLIIGFWFFMMQSTQGGSGRVMNFGKSRAKMQGEGKVNVTFKDVAGADEAKQELEEVVEFLRNPSKFNAIGAKIPKGVLLFGPPGTGKTLLARAVAGEAGVPFFTISGSDFVEMFVGVGASRVRDLFSQAKKNAPCIIFIDEIDAVGRQRGAGLGGGHDEREQTLNQLLVEMDGFGANEGIITIAATNRPDILDPALLRPGRFDRQVTVGRPDLRGREAILKVHARNKPLDSDVDLKTIAKKVPGFTGADLSNLLNEAALLAARQNRKSISMHDLEEASEKVSYGPERRSHIVSDKERELTAYHESGHAIVAHLWPEADPVHKVTIIPRGSAGGYTMMLPQEEKNYMTRSQLLAQIRVALGGRCAEAVVLKEISSGASGDLQMVTNIAREMITRLGMSDELGPLVFGEHQEQVFLGKSLGSERNYGEAVAEKIDTEMHRIVAEAYGDVMNLLTENIDFLHAMAKALLEEETIDAKQVENLYRYGSLLSPEEEQAKREAEENSKKTPLEAAGIVMPEKIDTSKES
ncbi:ATP-dependent zinc metalloprotease FtsH [Veillonella sp. CHU110]|uniref:ATP-dependent zinc metalloprotease FtsH n=1 Tax=Veillonella sp. CHU110 TaxID=2490947 RepID=UPI000F8F15E1|nr:ATP-dependent zinc metalloprotease FtsH [Veillonella sp. CHU110]